MTTRSRYLLFQLPGWCLGALACAVLWRWALVPEWAAGVALAAWVAKDLALYPLVRIAYEPADPDGLGSLAGARAVAREPLDPEGWVEVHGQLWRARLVGDEAAVPRGGGVTVEARAGLTLLVRVRRPAE